MQNSKIEICPRIRSHEHDDNSFGNIRDKNLLDIINTTDFKKYWDIKKDKIKTSKDCEYRYMCVD